MGRVGMAMPRGGSLGGRAEEEEVDVGEGGGGW